MLNSFHPHRVALWSRTSINNARILLHNCLTGKHASHVTLFIFENKNQQIMSGFLMIVNQFFFRRYIEHIKTITFVDVICIWKAIEY